MIKNTPVNAEDLGSIPGPVRSSEGGNGNPLQYFLPGTQGAWQATIPGLARDSDRT